MLFAQRGKKLLLSYKSGVLSQVFLWVLGCMESEANASRPCFSRNGKTTTEVFIQYSYAKKAPKIIDCVLKCLCLSAYSHVAYIQLGALEFPAHDESVNSCILIHGDRVIATCSDDKSIAFWVRPGK